MVFATNLNSDIDPGEFLQHSQTEKMIYVKTSFGSNNGIASHDFELRTKLPREGTEDLK